MLDKNWCASEITARYGIIKRARGCYLYTAKGARLVDLFQENGRAILGWGGGKAKRVFKNVFETGLTGSFESKYQHGLECALKKLLPNYAQARLYSSAERLCTAFSRYFDRLEYLQQSKNSAVNCVTAAGMNSAKEPSIDDLFFEHKIPVWRPWLDETGDTLKEQSLAQFLQKQVNIHDAAAIIPPFPWAGTCYIGVFTEKHAARILPSDLIAPPLLAAITRSLHDLCAEIPRRSETDWNQFDEVILRYWKRCGPYLISRLSQEKYIEFFLHCLDNKVVISPEYLTPSIVPFGATSGDFNLLQKNPFVF